VSTTVRVHSGSTARKLLGGGVIFGAAIAVAACGASAGTSASGSGSSASPSSAASSASAGAAGATSSSAVTVSTKNVPGVGPVLVNGKGQTLYLLTSEKGGKITCTASNGCTQAWPETTLPSGTTAAKAGTGVKSSLLGTVKGATGAMEVTYNGWPLYTFAGDSGAAGVAHGQALTSFGGTWYVLNAAGNPVTAKAAAAGSSSSSGSGGSGGYGY
jgi:predicted lipoprotein with Yx(FWY)xxD motif